MVAPACAVPARSFSSFLVGSKTCWEEAEKTARQAGSHDFEFASLTGLTLPVHFARP